MDNSPKPKKILNTFDLVCLGINGVVGTGIFVLPGMIAHNAGWLAPFLFLICGLLCFSIALCFAEMASAFHRTGAAYVYATEAFGPFVGFMVGWEIWISSLVGWSAVASSFLLALSLFFPHIGVSTTGKFIVAAFIILLSFLNFLGARIGALASNILSMSKLIPLFLFIILGFRNIDIQVLFHQTPPTTGMLSIAFLQVLYVFSGFEEMPLPSSEVKNVSKSAPRAILIVLSSVTIFYFLIQFVAQASCPDLASYDKTPLAKCAQMFAGNAGSLLLGVGAIISIAGVNTGIALTGPRSLFALARDKFLPEFLATLHPRYHTPYIAIIINTAIVLFLTLTGTFATLVNMCALASLLQYIPTCLAVIALRIKKPDLKREYKLPGGFVIPIIAIITCVLLFFQAKPNEIIGSLVLLAISVPIYFVFKKEREKENKDRKNGEK